MRKNILRKIKTLGWRIKSILAMYYYGNPAKKLKIVGVTGTNGKTTTATLLYKIATGLGYKAGLIGTAGNMIAGVKSDATHTTPDSITLTKLFKDMFDAGCEYVFMEVSSHALDQKRVFGVKFTGAIFTNLTHDHLDYHKNMTEYFLAKKKLFNMLPKSAFALSNADDEHGKKMLEGIDARKFLYEFFNVHGTATLQDKFVGEILKIYSSGLELTIGDTLVKSKLLGKFNAYNLLAVWSASSLLGFDMNKVRSILENIEPPKGRFDHFTSPSGVLAIVDYAHTPDALEKIFKAVKDIKAPDSRIISVFGCGGDRDPMKRPIMGKIGAMNSDIVIMTSDNPRSEDPTMIIEVMKEALSPQLLEKVISMPLRREAIREAVRLAQLNDIILVAGKGHEDYQEIKGVKSHFDDMEELKKALEENKK
ncbi:MAG: UDP-N-acetylmuramoyl-L-alanyl-D-glutamate--2,6-diaminopimelate ligase [Patescibacteria group bacterium]